MDETIIEISAGFGSEQARRSLLPPSARPRLTQIRAVSGPARLRDENGMWPYCPLPLQRVAGLSHLEPEDEEFLATFADTTQLRVPFTSDSSEIRSALAGAVPCVRTALFDAVALAIRQMRTARNARKVLFLVSDGGDNHSRYTEHEFLKSLEEADLQIHAIGIHDGMAGMDEKRGPWILEDLAGMTGRSTPHG